MHPRDPMGHARPARLVVAAAALAALPACRSTEIVVRVSTDLPQGCERGVTAVEVRVTTAASTAFTTNTSIDPSHATNWLPGELALYPRDDDALGRVVEVIATARGRGDQVLVTRRALARYTPDEVVLLTVPLSASCVGVGPCATNQTCVEGRCEVLTVPTALPRYTPLDRRAPARCVGAAFDAGMDAPDDAPRDAVLDEPTDAPRDTGADAGMDAPRDTGADTGMDAPRDTGVDTGVDVVRDTGVDVPPDVPVGPTVIRQLLPPSSSFVTTARPALRWVLPRGATGARVEVCPVRTCTTRLLSVDVTGSNHGVASPLPRGTLFWRVTPLSSVGLPIAVPSPSWPLTVVGAASRGAWWGRAPHFNGDALGDLAIGVADTPGEGGRVRTYLGGGVGGLLTASTVLEGPTRQGYGFAVAAAGDVDGDGYGDLIVGAPYAEMREGAAYVYRGGASGIVVAPLAVLNGPAGYGGFFGNSVGGAGDVDGDGYGDVIVGAWSERDGTGAAYVFRGGPDGVGRAPFATLRPPTADGAGVHYGYVVAGVGDLDGDGYDDVAVAAPNTLMGTGRVHVYYGGALGPRDATRVSLDGMDGMSAYFGQALAGIGDFTGDGLPDFAVTAYTASVGGVRQTGRAYVFAGGDRPVARTPARVIESPFGMFGYLGESVAGVPDGDGDGLSDVAVGAPRMSGSTGGVFVVHGSSAVPSPRRTQISVSQAGGRFGAAIGGADLNGDGYWELVVGSPSFGMSAGRVQIYRGAATGYEPGAPVTLPGMDGTGNQFGRALTGGH